MVIKKTSIFISLALLVLFISSASALLEIKKTEVSSMAVRDINLPAIFNLDITNLGAADYFRIYSFAGVNIEPSKSFFINAGETINLTLKAYPTAPLKISPDYLSFEYEIKGDKTEKQKDELAISMVNLREAFDFYAESINPESSMAIIHLDNKAGHSFEDISLQLDSSFFSDRKQFSLSPKEQKQFEIIIDKSKSQALLAGPYIINAVITTYNVSAKTTTLIQFTEKPGIETKESKEGVIFVRHEIEKANIGNLNTMASIVVSNNFFSSLFTSFNIRPTKVDWYGLKKSYIFESELAPGKSLKVVATTNWWILIIIILAIVLIIYLVDKYFRTKLIITKQVYPVRTKGGEFALKISIKVKARDFVEKIRLIERLPPMLKLFDRPGFRAPDKIDESNRRIEWNMSALGRGEERLFEYIAYSKVGLVGRFELPAATAIFESNNKLKDVESNRAVFDNEPRKSEL